MAVVILDDEARLARKLWHKSLTDEVLIETMERSMSSLDDPGFCLICGCEAYGIEPDARRVKCEAGAPQVVRVEVASINQICNLIQ